VSSDVVGPHPKSRGGAGQFPIEVPAKLLRGDIESAAQTIPIRLANFPDPTVLQARQQQQNRG
jgi:hypothetical protein